MADPASNDLPYGHFGRAVYDPDEHIWSFERDPGTGDVLRPVGEPRLVAKPAEDSDAPTSTRVTLLKPSERHGKEIKDVIKRFPDVQPASSLLPQLLRVSEAVASATARHDPLKGGLLAVGSIPTEAHHGTIRVAAFPTGPTGSDLRIVQVQLQRRGWGDQKSAWIKVPTAHGEEALWSGEGTPIQQICFAHSIEGTDTFLAVRMLARTLIFRPVLRSQPVRAGMASRLDVKLCFEVSLASTGGLPHADVAFNPWYTRQFGLVDQAGGWAIWELHGRSANTGKVICRSLVQKERSKSTRPQDDGWARLAWVCNPETVAICTRRQLTLYKFSGSGSTSMVNVVFKTYPETGWYHAMVTIPSHPAYLAVLTSTYLVIYSIHASGTDRCDAKLILRIRHFRNPEDATLSVDALKMADDPVIVLRSGVEPVVTLYRLHFNDIGVRAAVPAALELPSGVASQDSGRSIAGLHFGSVAYGFRGKKAEHRLVSDYLERGMTFASLMVLGKDHALQEILYVSTPAGAVSGDVIPPTWESMLKASAAKLRRESFVVDDDDEMEANSGDYTEPVSLYQQRRALQEHGREGLEWTITLALSAQAMANVDDVEPVSVDDIVESAKSILREPKMDAAMSWRTLWDLAHGEVFLRDVEESAAQLDGLADVERRPMEPSQDAEEVQPSVPLALRSLSSRPAMSLTTVYNGMVIDWITPLSPVISGRQRLAKEHLVRRAAAEVSLAFCIIGTRVPQPQTQPETQASQESFDLPMRAGPSSSQLQGPSSQLASSLSVLPTPSPTATPSVTTVSSHPSTFAAPEINRLSRYTSFSNPAPPALPRSLNDVLTHWSVGTNPADYDWRAASRRVAEREDEETDEQMTEKERARLQRRAERHIKRQRREAAASQAAQLASSQALQIVSASQPQQVARTESRPGASAGGSQSQSQGLGAGPTSQVVPGRFGGRPPRKKRKQGF